MSDLTGRQLNDYRVLRRLGRGAMAEVYLAEQQSLARQVALKVLSSELAAQPNYVERFQHEARSAAALVHANIVQVYEVGQANGSHFIAQEYVAGQNLAEWMRRHGQVEPGRVLDILRQVAAALSKAHERSIVHRDVKPENIMLSRTGEVKVADFGLARVTTDSANNRTQAGVTMGTPLYMSPEQIEGRPVDSRSDIYSLGVTAYHMLAGEPPFQGETPLSVAVQHVNKQPLPITTHAPATPPALVALVERMMAKKPDDRYTTPLELLHALRSLAKQASDEGWAEGPENWSASDLATLSSSQIEATSELDQLMRGTRALQLPNFERRRIIRLIVVAALAGAALAFLLRRPYVLADSEPDVLNHDSAIQQLFHARMIDTPAGWQAAIDHPDANIAEVNLAKQGLARHYLHEGQYREALEPLEELANAPRNQKNVRTFANVALAIAYSELGNLDEARRHRQLVSTTDVQELPTDQELVELFYSLDL
ncbi:serine/threonine-protein kinase [Aeoliella mucimassa]|uniref:non-specific serine/threonine protein kinase n=1 Tax=Aeoliella mucimassa TaxID=2527972 RepID=A0A518AI35_9BACT|nr:serine/threonine-protein kinase [Aeoliella mucimassa]QDU54386.1 Serine/threonine-protein kinase PknB [Aeoliella mucimassa]